MKRVIYILVMLFISTTVFAQNRSIEMILVEAGSFDMGSTGGDEDEKPVHSVTISKDYYIGKFEVTQKEWIAQMGSNPSEFKGDNLPVEKVSWYDTVEFCNKLSNKEGLTPAYIIDGTNVTISSSSNGYRLPTEAQWEFAARGGNLSRKFIYSGSNSVDEVAWYSANTIDERTQIVGSKKSNELGIYDMSGNVYEWCYDWLGEYSSESKIDPVCITGIDRLIRGASWYNDAPSTRNAYRGYDSPDGSYDNLGFRIVLPA